MTKEKDGYSDIDITIPEFLIRVDTPEAEQARKAMARQASTSASEADRKAQVAQQAAGAEKVLERTKTPAKSPAKAAEVATGNGAKVPAKKAAEGAKKAPAAKKAEGKAPAAKKPSSVELDIYGFRKGSLKSSAAALYGRKQGATLDEIKTATGSSQLNLLKELEAGGEFKVRKEKETGKGKKPVTRYFLSK